MADDNNFTVGPDGVKHYGEGSGPSKGAPIKSTIGTGLQALIAARKKKAEPAPTPSPNAAAAAKASKKGEK